MSAVLFGGFVVLLIIGVPVAVVMGGATLAAILWEGRYPGLIIAQRMFSGIDSFPLMAIPFFVLAAELMTGGKITDSLLSLAQQIIGRLRGGLGHANILMSVFFSGISGSALADAAGPGAVTIQMMRNSGYKVEYAAAVTASSAIISSIIPPSIIMIVYGVIAQQSVARLFIAGIVPGLVLILLFSGYIAIWAKLNPDKRGEVPPTMPFMQKLKASRDLLPVLLLITAIIGSIYRGLATPTEAASIGILGAFILSFLNGTMSRRMFIDSLMAATRISCMISFIIACAACLSIAVGFADIPRVAASWVNSMNLSPTMLIVVLTIFFLILGCFLEGISILVLSSSVVLPMVHDAGIDLIWFGIFAVIVIECAQITPPVGFNLIVLKSLTGKGIGEVARDTLPFLLILLTAIVLFAVFPGLVTFLPELMYR